VCAASGANGRSKGGSIIVDPPFFPDFFAAEFLDRVSETLESSPDRSSEVIVFQ
jgi:hypothetical protein